MFTATSYSKYYHGHIIKSHTLFVSLAWFITQMYRRAVLSNDCYLNQLYVEAHTQNFYCCSFNEQQVMWCAMMWCVRCGGAEWLEIGKICNALYGMAQMRMRIRRRKKSIKSTHFMLEYIHNIHKHIDHKPRVSVMEFCIHVKWFVVMTHYNIIITKNWYFRYIFSFSPF